MDEFLHLSLERITTPIGEMLIVSDQHGNLRAIDWAEYETRMQRFMRLHYGNAAKIDANTVPRALTDPIRSYFAGELTAIDELPVQTAGTPFQRAVWQALREIPSGRTLSYGQLAQRIGRPTAVRAVGLANGSNPIGVVVPCHRVIGANGSLTGYGGGIDRKRWLLQHEQTMANRAATEWSGHRNQTKPAPLLP